MREQCQRCGNRFTITSDGRIKRSHYRRENTGTIIYTYHCNGAFKPSIQEMKRREEKNA